MERIDSAVCRQMKELYVDLHTPAHPFVSLANWHSPPKWIGMQRNHHQQLELPVDHLGLTLDHGLASSLPGYKLGVDTSGRDLGLEGIAKHRVGAVQARKTVNRCDVSMYNVAVLRQLLRGFCGKMLLVTCAGQPQASHVA